jgi:glutathione S-transferase
MPLILYQHPLSSYVQKAKTAFYEKGIAFTSRMLDGGEPVASEYAALWPVGKFPTIVHDGTFIFEATGIIEYLEAAFPDTPRLIPADPLAAQEVRMWDRFFDNYVMYPQGRVVAEAIGIEPGAGDGYARWHAKLETAYALLDRRMESREWAAADRFAPPGLSPAAAGPAELCAGAGRGEALPAHVPAGRARGAGLSSSKVRSR